MAVLFSVSILGAVSISSRTVGFWGRRGRWWGGGTGQAREAGMCYNLVKTAIYVEICMLLGFCIM